MPGYNSPPQGGTKAIRFLPGGFFVSSPPNLVDAGGGLAGRPRASGDRRRPRQVAGPGEMGRPYCSRMGF